MTMSSNIHDTFRAAPGIKGEFSARVVMCALLFFTLSLGTQARGGGMDITEHSARSTGMGGAVVAATGDPTNIHINPASLSFYPGMHFSFGATVMIPEEKFTLDFPDRTETKMAALVNFPPNVYLSYGSASGFGAGIGVSAPVASKTEWSSDWTGKRIVTKSEMRVITVTPALSIRPSEALAFGAGVNIAVPKLLYEERIPVADPLQSYPDGTATYEAGGDVAYGVQVGILYRPSPTYSFGLSYRSSMTISIDDGQLSYRDIPEQLNDRYPDGTFQTDVPLPPELRAGVCWQPTSWFGAVADIQYGFWSQLKSFNVTFANPDRPSMVVTANWKNVVNTRFGIEIAIEDVSLRGGLRYDHSPIPDETLSPGFPDADATVYSAGLGYRIGEDLLLDFAYEFMDFRDRHITSSMLVYDDSGRKLNGTYSARTTSIALNISYSWH
jgi:long-chain fatty acid transport protein